MIFPYSGYRFRILKSIFQTNYLIGLYLGIIYNFTIASTANLFYDNINIDIFSFASSSIAYMLLSLEILIYAIFIWILKAKEGLLENPEFETANGILYDTLKLGIHERGLNIFLSIKIQLLILISFILQNYPLAQVITFVLVYIGSLSYQLKMKAYSEISNFIQSVIREILFAILSVLFFTYHLIENFHSYVQEWLQNAILIVMLLIMSNEILFSIFDFIIYIKDICFEKSIIKINRRKSKILQLRVEILKHRSRYSYDEENSNYSRIRIRNRIFNRMKWRNISQIVLIKSNTNFTQINDLLNSNLNRIFP